MSGGHKQLVLASGSPRRREILESAGLRFEVEPPGIFESPPLDGEPAERYVGRLAWEKASEVSGRLGTSIAPASSSSALDTGRESKVVLGADTVVVLDGEILGKPASHRQAVGMLRRLRGRAHQVTTGVVVVDGGPGQCASVAVSSEVHMRCYGNAEIAAYVASGEPFDKAGGYAVQDGDFRPADGVEGCYLNVVGLPLCEALTLLSRTGCAATPRKGWKPPSQCAECPLADAG